MTKVAKAMIDVADSMESLARCIRECGASLMGEQGTVQEKTDPLGKAPSEESVPAEEPEKKWLLEDVRMVLAEKSRQGHTEEVRALIARYGADRLSDIKPADFASLIAEAEVIGNG